MWHHCTLVDALVDEVSAVGQTRRTSMEKHGERSERVCDRGASAAAACRSVPPGTPSKCVRKDDRTYDNNAAHLPRRLAASSRRFKITRVVEGCRGDMYEYVNRTSRKKTSPSPFVGSINAQSKCSARRLQSCNISRPCWPRAPPSCDRIAAPDWAPLKMRAMCRTVCSLTVLSSSLVGFRAAPPYYSFSRGRTGRRFSFRKKEEKRPTVPSRVHSLWSFSPRK